MSIRKKWESCNFAVSSNFIDIFFFFITHIAQNIAILEEYFEYFFSRKIFLLRSRGILRNTSLFKNFSNMYLDYFWIFRYE